MEYDIPSFNPFCFSEEVFCFSFEIFRVHEMHSQLEVTEIVERKVNLTA